MNYKIFFLFILINNFSKALMTVHEYRLDLWHQDMIPLEYTAYKILKKFPINKKINYLAIPWAALIDNNKLNLIPSIKLNGGFTITRSVQFELIIPILKKIGIDVLFTPHAYGKKYDGVKVLPMPHLNLNGIGPNKKKDIFYSFIGCNDNPIRKKIFQMSHPKSTVIIKRQTLHFYIDIWENSLQSKLRKEKEKHQYQDILSRSRFSLCPSGRGPGTLRFWESLQAGAIPILISDELCLPKNYDWNSCIIRIPINNLKNLTQILSSIDSNKENMMRIKCLEFHKIFSKNNLIKVIHDYYEKLPI